VHHINEIKDDIHRSFRSLSVCCAFLQDPVVEFQVEFLRWHPAYIAAHVAKLAHPFRESLGLTFFPKNFFKYP